MYTKNESVATFSEDLEDLEESRKDEAQRSIFDRVLGVWKCDEALSVIFFYDKYGFSIETSFKTKKQKNQIIFL